ncbi:hypothetical protein QX776_12975 [Alteromonadaceae bacterium BrNp21-10]|nr:hypothetical protein [Alteromonadaceae bacterium BrNp21-10]
MNKVVRLALSFMLASITTFILASIAHTQFVLNGLVDVGVVMNMAIRIEMSLKDLAGLAPGYGSILTLSLLLAFVVMSSIRNRYRIVGQHLTYWVYPVGGFIAVLTVHLLMKPIFDVTLIAGARSFMGLMLQCLSGAVGGVIYTLSLKYLRRYHSGNVKKHRRSRRSTTTMPYQ